MAKREPLSVVWLAGGRAMAGGLISFYPSVFVWLHLESFSVCPLLLLRLRLLLQGRFV